MADGSTTPTPRTEVSVPLSPTFIVAFLTGRIGSSEDSDSARFDLIERLGSILRSMLLAHGPLGSFRELAARLGVRLVRIGALPSEYCNERGRPMGGCWWLSIVGEEIAAVSTIADDDDERGGIEDDALAVAVGARLLMMLGVPAHTVVRKDELLDVHLAMCLSVMIPRAELEFDLPLDQEGFVVDHFPLEVERISRRLGVPTSMVNIRAERLNERALLVCEAA